MLLALSQKKKKNPMQNKSTQKHGPITSTAFWIKQYFCFLLSCSQIAMLFMAQAMSLLVK